MNGKIHWTLGAAALLLASVPTAPATAQETGNPPERPQGEPRQSGDRPDARRPGSRDPGQQVDQGRQGDQGLVPEGYVRIWTDTDGDGRFDAVETIYAFDLEEARRSSAGRQGGGGQGPQGGPPQPARVEGKIVNLKGVRLYGMEEEHVLARVETGEGRTAKVDLGPRPALSDLNLKEGDTVTVVGSRGTINDRPLLVADRVESGDKSVQIERPAGRALQRVKGEVTRTRTAKFRGRDGDHLIADLRLHSGRRATAILGPASRLSDLEIKRGDELSLLARPGRLNGDPALVAEQVRAGDRTVEIQRTRARNRTESQPGDSSGGQAGSSGQLGQGREP